MAFAHYKRPTRTQQRIYRRSDEIGAIRLSKPTLLPPLVQRLTKALEEEDRVETEAVCRKLVDGITADPGVSLSALKCWRRGRITVWMRTAKRRQVVAFRTLLRTLLHELCHHLDYKLLQLSDSFHTEGFYRRESSLFHQLTGKHQAREQAPARKKRSDTSASPAAARGIRHTAAPVQDAALPARLYVMMSALGLAM